MNTDIVTAIENLNIIEFYYEGELRVVEPHCYGETTAGNEGLRAYQIDGYSSTGKFGWKMYDLGKADDITVTDQVFNGSREGYKRGGQRDVTHIHRTINCLQWKDTETEAEIQECLPMKLALIILR